MRFHRVLALLMVLCASFACPTYSQELTFGIVPQQSSRTMAEMWDPFITALSDRTGFNIKFATAKDIPAFEQRVLAGEYDIAYMNPYHYTVFSQQPGYIAIAKQRDKKIKGILVVPKNSPVKTIDDLLGKELAFPSPAAFAASVLPRAYLQKVGINISSRYVSSHDSVYISVARGFFVAGGGIKRTFNTVSPEIRDQLRILWETPEYTPHAIALNPKLDAKSREILQRAMLEMSETPEFATVFEKIGFPMGLEFAKDSDWNDVRELNIDLLQHLIEPSQ